MKLVSITRLTGTTTVLLILTTYLSHIHTPNLPIYLSVYRLYVTIAEHEAHHASLVEPSVLFNTQAQLAATRTENLRLIAIHKQLLHRYSAVKHMIDTSFRRLDDIESMQGIYVIVVAVLCIYIRLNSCIFLFMPSS